MPRFAHEVCATRRVLAVMRWPVGGIRTYIRYNYPTLADAGYCFTFLGPDDETFRAFADEFRSWEGVEFVAARARGNRCRLWPAVRGLLRCGRYDAVHSHGMIAACHSAVANWGPGLPHVVTSHDVFRPCHAAGPVGKAKLWAVGRLLRGADTIVAVSDDVRDNLFEYLPPLRGNRCPVVSILNGIDTRAFGDRTDREDWLRRRVGVRDNDFLIGFLGRFMEQKGFLPLLDALAVLVREGTVRPFRLVAVGSGDCERRYRGEVDRRGLGRFVCFFEFTPDVAPVLRQLDLLVMPSLWEAAGILAMEAMCVGVPVLGSDCIGLREVLRGTPSVTAAAGDTAAWSQALREAIATPWTQAARAYAPEARQRYDVVPAATKLLGVFDNLLTTQRRDCHGRRVRRHPLFQRREIPAPMP